MMVLSHVQLLIYIPLIHNTRVVWDPAIVDRIPRLVTTKLNMWNEIDFHLIAPYDE
jgi:hypothetical protein